MDLDPYVAAYRNGLTSQLSSLEEGLVQHFSEQLEQSLAQLEAQLCTQYEALDTTVQVAGDHAISVGERVEVCTSGVRIDAGDDLLAGEVYDWRSTDESADESPCSRPIPKGLEHHIVTTAREATSPYKQAAARLPRQCEPPDLEAQEDDQYVVFPLVRTASKESASPSADSKTSQQSKEPELLRRPSAMSSVGSNEAYSDGQQSLFGPDSCGLWELYELQLLGPWREPKKKVATPRRNSFEDPKGEITSASFSAAACIRNVDSLQMQEVNPVAKFITDYIIFKPNNRFCLAWDCFTVLVLMYDLVVIPLQAYPLPESRLWKMMEIATTFTWTLDICLTFFKGYEVRGDTEMHPKAIALHYLKTWFGFDISIVGVDWLLFMLEGGDLVDWLRFSRFRRALRLLRIARLVKVASRCLMQVNGAQSNSEGGMVGMRVAGLMLLLVVINHFISCGWYAIGMAGIYDLDWTQRAFVETDARDLAYLYFTSFHWSVTQFTPASMEIYPRNAMERVYNIVCIFFGLLMFSSFVSSMTSSMTHLTQLNVQKRQKREILMSYMNARGLSLQLRDDIINLLSSSRRSQRNRALCEQDVAALEVLPPGLLTRLHIEVHMPVMERHAFFRQCILEEPSMVFRLCHRAMSERVLAAGEELFRFGIGCRCMYFTVSGESKYVVGFGEEQSYPVGPQQWLCEASLWVEWEHRGQLNAKTVCEISKLDGSEFATIMSRSELLPEIQRYARMYAHHLERENGGAQNVTDNWGQKLRVLDLAQRAFKPPDEEEADKDPASRLMMLWRDESISISDAFAAWRNFYQRQKQNRLWWHRLTCRRCCIRRLSKPR